MIETMDSGGYGVGVVHQPMLCVVFYPYCFLAGAMKELPEVRWDMCMTDRYAA